MAERTPGSLEETTTLGAEVGAVVPVGDGWKARLLRQKGGAILRVDRGSEDQILEIHITLGADGPVVRARAASLEIEAAKDLVARCERFRVEAETSIEMISAGTIRAEGRRLELEATHGSARVRANDDVQLLGENVLLNCDRSPPMPAWVSRPAIPPSPCLPAEEVSGDREILATAKEGR